MQKKIHLCNYTRTRPMFFSTSLIFSLVAKLLVIISIPFNGLKNGPEQIVKGQIINAQKSLLQRVSLTFTKQRGHFSISAALNVEYLFRSPSPLVVKWPPSVLNRLSKAGFPVYSLKCCITLCCCYLCPGRGYFSLELRDLRFNTATKQIEVTVCSLPRAQVPAGVARGAQGEQKR